jgi:hypothetical protein
VSSMKSAILLFVLLLDIGHVIVASDASSLYKSIKGSQTKPHLAGASVEPWPTPCIGFGLLWL